MAMIPMHGTFGYRSELSEDNAVAAHVPSQEELDSQRPMTKDQQAKLTRIPRPKEYP
jgi:hypothetical protein